MAFMWNAATGEKVQRYKLDRGGRGVVAIALSEDGTVACVDNSNDHNVYFFKGSTGERIWKEKGDNNKIFDVCFNYGQGGELVACTAGTKHIKFWTPHEQKVQKGLFGDMNLATSFACCAFDDKGLAYTGGSNSNIYIWAGRSLKSRITEAHKGGFVCAMRFVDGFIYSGGKDGNVTLIDTSNHTVSKCISMGDLVRAIDVQGRNALVGLRNGTIYHVNLDSEEKKVVMESHSDGEVWGLASIDGEHVITTADDNKVKVWKTSERKCT